MGDLASIVNQVGSALNTGLDLATDPYFTETVCHIGQLHQINNKQAPGQCSTTPDGLPGGVGLGKVQPFLRGYVYSQEHPWVIPVVGALVFAVPFMLGYSMRRGS
jgi:hypothetical protein